MVLEQFVSSPSELLARLIVLQNKKFIFRGHSSGKYILQPFAFRIEGLLEFAKKYPGKAHADKHKWVVSNATNYAINTWVGGIRSPEVNRIIDYTLYLMMYNHAMQEFYSENGSLLDENDLRLLSTFPFGYWARQETFQGLFTFICRSLSYIECVKTGNILKKPDFPNESTGFDESWAQHYQLPTVRLDWSHNPLVAIYFALGSSQSKYLSIFAFKEKTVSETTPVKVVSGTPSKFNLRLVRQEGTFTCFTQVLNFFLTYGEFPYIELYNSNEFEVMRFNLERTTTNLSFLRAHIKKRDICESFLLPDKKEKILQTYTNETIILDFQVFNS